ncbi:MAG: L,D-transpeptidase family protein [Verrucomicrobiota bacterium]
MMRFLPCPTFGFFTTLVSALLLLANGARAGGSASGAVRPEVRQLLVGIAPDWDASTARLLGLERGADGVWKPTLGPIPVLLGKNGLAWGRGVLGTDEPGLHKAERDARAPAGVFQLGQIYTYDRTLPKGARYPFHTVTAADAWVDDPKLPDYNRFVTVDPKNPPPWFEKQKMRHNDFAYRWLVEVRHNADPPVAGMGSAIFFHIRRGETRPTWGCTSMAEPDLVSLIRWLRAEAQPHYALLPWDEYQRKWQAWGLPSPEAVGAIRPK